MGGNALKTLGVETRRISKAEYLDISSAITERLSKVYDKFTIIPSYREKEDFGDADILIADNGKKHLDIIKELFSQTVYKNDVVYSFPYNNFQIDLIFIEPSCFDVGLTYLSYNDAGNLCGKVFHSLGLKYGHLGLNFLIRESNFGDVGHQNVLSNVCLSKNPKEILEFGGFDFNIFTSGFDVLEDIFDWVAKGKYFNAEKFKYENLNYENRTRNRKRTTYQKFLTWLEVNKNKYPQVEFSDDKSVYISLISSAFPLLKTAFEEAKVKYEKNCELKSKFNGTNVGEWTGLSAISLGCLMKQYAGSFGSKDNFENFLLNHSINDIRKSVVSFYETE